MKQGSLGTLSLGGRLTCDNAPRLIEALTATLDLADIVTVDCSSVLTVDIICIQAFCSAFRISVRKGKELSVKGLEPSVFSCSPDEIRALCSSYTSYGCNKKCLWVCGETPVPAQHSA
jgi:ABC-type transporter Mla MlaB component